jgi:hypothetical protein
MLLKVVSLRPTEKMGWHGFTLPNATGHRAARALRPTLKAAKPPAAAGKEPLPVVPVPIWLFDLKDLKDLSDHCDRYIPLPCDVITQPATGAPCSQEAPSLGHPTSSSVPQPLDQGVEVTEASAKQVRNCYIYIYIYHLMRHCLQELLCTFHADMHLVYQPLVKGKNILRGITNLRLAAGNQNYLCVNWACLTSTPIFTNLSQSS